MSGYVLSKEASEDIDEIFNFGKVKFGYSLAIDYLIGLESLFVKLASSPYIGRERNEIKQELRSFPYSSHVVFYRVLDTKIRIVCVLYGGSDLVRFLD